MPVRASVVIDDIVSSIDKYYDYLVPDELAGKVQAGIRVIVPFSRSNMRKKALVMDVAESEDVSKLKSVIDVFDKEPVAGELQLDLIKLLRDRYFVTYYNALKTIVPRGIDFKIREYYCLEDQQAVDEALAAFFSSKRNKVDKEALPTELIPAFNDAVSSGRVKRVIDAEKGIGELSEKKLVLELDFSDAERFISELDNRFAKQKDLLSVFLDYPEISEKDALYYSGCGPSTVKTLVNKGVISVRYDKIERNPYKDIERKYDVTSLDLNSEQQKVFDGIRSRLFSNAVHLIQGVTGSGKTVVYTALMDEVLKKGKSVLFLVPEISLTPQTLARFYGRYGDLVAVAHSGLAPGERADEWRKIKKLPQSVVVGTRSAVFAPINDLGLIIMDEEHEQSYKSESSPRYHARDIARYIAAKLDIPLVLGSATPATESRYSAEKGKYVFHRLDKRYNAGPLPETEIVDMRTSFKEGDQSFLSETLRDAIEENITSGNQTILFLNRRGAYTMVGCRSCGYVAKCDNCGVALTYHIANGRCMCHYCGQSIRMFDKCPSCGSEHIKKLGIGTQLVSSELEDIFPNAKILRMDYDTVSSYVSYGNKLNSFKNGDYNILLGTQMVAKGLDFPNVTLVGVLNADLSLYVDDFRANERTFSLLTQVCGRSGRAEKPGKAIIQTYSPDYEVIRYAKEQDFDRYYDFEIKFRKAMNYPPFCDLVLFTVSNKSEGTAYKDVSGLYKKLDALSKSEYSDIPVRLLYPTTPKIIRVNNKFRFNLLMKTRVCKRLYELLKQIDTDFRALSSDVSINVNPINNS